MKSTDITKRETKEMMTDKLKEYLGKCSLCSITGRHSIELCGCCGLVTYKDELMEILLCDSLIRISGKHLTLKHYYGGRMIISGIIDSVEYCDMGGLKI